MREKSVKKGWLGDTASNHYRQVGPRRAKVAKIGLAGSAVSAFFRKNPGLHNHSKPGLYPGNIGIQSRLPMADLSEAFQTALRLIATLDPNLIGIVLLSLKVSLTAVVIASMIGFALGGALAVYRFPGRGAVTATLSALMGLPPVVAGLVVYLLLSNTGPLGVLQLLYTPTAMIIAQVVIVTPIVGALTRQACEDLLEEYDEQLRSLGASSAEIVWTLLWDGRYRLITAVLAGFGRAIAEVGAVMIVGGNIDHVTRTMTTAIALETSKGNITLALALGIVLLVIAFAVNAALLGVRRLANRLAYA
jgi:tungstate transport system permease protein